MADGSLPIVVTPEAFGRGSFDLAVIEGLTVRGALVEAVKAGLDVNLLDRTEIYIDGARLPREVALDRVLKAGELIHFVVEPLGGGGGGGKDIGQILVSLAVLAVSSWIGGMALFASNQAMLVAKLVARTALQVGVLVGGAALVSSMGQRDTPARANDRYALQSASNQYRQWGTMPLALGEVVAAPDLAVKTFTQSEGDDVWLYGILGVHYGPCEVSEVKIGDTLVSTMGPGDFRMVQHLEPGPRAFQLYPNDVDQLDLQEELQATPSSATPLVRAASSDGSRFGFDFFLPAGLHFQKDDGRLIDAAVSVAVRYRPIDMTGAATGPWQNGPTMSRRARSKDPMRITHWVSLPHGRYEFELTRSRPDDDNAKRQDRILLTAIKAVAFRKPVTDETLSLIEFAVRASAINQGGLAPITCRIKPKCPIWTGSGWGPAVATSNPAALARWLLTGPAPAKPLLPAQVDLRLRAWSGLCEQYDWDCHVYLTETKTQAEVLQILERAGRAWLFWDGVQVAASPWVEKPAPRQLFTGANLRDHRWEIAYPDPVHALRVEFLNLEKGGEADELFVYADGYGEVADPANGVKAATLVEALRLDGQATSNRAFRDGRWALGSLKLQRRVDTWTADIEHLVSQYGDRVRLAWRRPVNGAEARVRCRRWNADGSAVIGLRLTQPVRMEAGQEYAADLRTKDGLHVSVPVETVAGETREIRFADARSPALCPQADDLIAFGVSERVSEDVEIVGIEPGENLTAVITGVRYVAPLLMAGETGPIPSLPSRLSGDRNANPPRPTLLGVQEDAHGVRVSFTMPAWRGSPINGFTVRWRGVSVAGETASWAPLPPLDGAARELVAPPLREAPIEGVEATKVEFEITATTVDGRASKPLLVTVVKPVPGAPLASVWSVDAKGPDAHGVSQPILIVRGEITDPNVAAVRIAWGLTDNGPWTEAYQGAPLTKALEIGNLAPGVEHYVAITHLSAQGVPSQFLVIGPRMPGPLTAGDTTHLKGAPVQDVLDKLTDTATLADRTATEVQSIRDMYGDTADAATSAAKAAAHEAGANQAKAEAILAAEASDRRAEAADEAKLEAQQARAGAVSARNDSVAAAGASGDAAAIAAEERRLATEARGQAQAEAQAAVGARNQASSFADAAGVGAAASQEASLKATAAAITTIPDAIAADLWTDLGTSGAPADRPSLAPARVVGGAFVAPTGGAQSSGPKQRVRWVQGKVIEIRLRAEVPAGTPAASVRIGVARFDASHASLNYGSWMAITPVASGGSAEVVYRVGCGVSVPGGSTINAAPNLEWLSLGCTPNLNAAATAGMPGAQMRITAFSVRDITEEVNAGRSADASASSAASAAASDGAAGQKAAAAQRDMLAAQTARGGAESAEIRAVEARDDAQGHASTAASQAGLSAQYRDQSQTAAEASNEAAGIATTKADQAGASAQAANADRLAAQAARDTADQKAQASVTAAARAEAFAGDAGDWAAAAEGAAVQAAASAGEGLSYRNQAVVARDGAVAASQSAGVSASTAQSVANRLIPDRVSVAADFAPGGNGDPATISPLTTGSVTTTSQAGAVRQFSNNQGVYTRGALSIQTGRTYRTTTYSRVVVDGVGNTFRSGLVLYNSAWQAIYSYAPTNDASAVVADGWQQFTVERTAEQLLALAPAAVHVRGFAQGGVTASGAASGATWQAAVLGLEDVTESVSAANSAAIAQSASASASADASSAQISADLAASVGAVRPNLLPNGGLEDGSVGMTGSGTLAISNDPVWGRNIKNVATSSGTHTIIWPAIGVRGNARYTISGDTGFFHTGSGGYSYLDLIFYRADGTQALDGPQKNINGPHDFSNAKERLQAHAVTVVAPADAVTARARAIFTNMNAPTFMGARRVKVEEGDLPATAFTSEASSNQIAAQLNITAAVAADAADRLASVRFDVTGGAGGAPFQIWGRAGPAGSMAGMVASELALSNVVNGMVVPALKLIGGDAHFGGRIHAGAGKEIIIDPTLPAIITTMGNARMAEGKLPNDNLIYWFGPKQEVANMRKSNATEWRDASGQAYFAGGISAGQLQSSGRTSDQSASVSAQTGVFGSLGKTITVNVTYTAENRIASTSYTPPFPPSSDTTTPGLSAQIRLYRSLGGGPFELVSTFTATGSSRVQVINYGDFSEEISSLICGGSSTYVDPALSTQTRQYRVEMSNRNFNWLIGNTQQKSQMLSVVCVEG